MVRIWVFYPLGPRFGARHARDRLRQRGRHSEAPVQTESIISHQWWSAYPVPHTGPRSRATEMGNQESSHGAVDEITVRCAAAIKK